MCSDNNGPQTFKMNLSHFIEFNWPETEFIVLLGVYVEFILVYFIIIYIQSSKIYTGADT
jgi:hypothetical protein